MEAWFASDEYKQAVEVLFARLRSKGGVIAFGFDELRLEPGPAAVIRDDQGTELRITLSGIEVIEA